MVKPWRRIAGFWGALRSRQRSPAFLQVNQRRYEILRELSHSPNGVLYLGRDDGRCEFVLKRPNQCFDDEDEMLFREEYEILESLRHPNIIRAVDYGLETRAGWHVLVMEYVRGNLLWKAVRESSEQEVFRYLIQTLKVCRYLHGLGFIHGDIKPDNILITEDRQTKIGDFGTAGCIGAKIKGYSPAFATPEQCADCGELAANSAIDFYAVGVTFYWLLTGVHPYIPEQATMPFEISYFENRPKPPMVLNPTINPLWNDWLLGLIAVDPAQRCQTAAAILAQGEPA